MNVKNYRIQDYYFKKLNPEMESRVMRSVLCTTAGIYFLLLPGFRTTLTCLNPHKCF